MLDLVEKYFEETEELSWNSNDFVRGLLGTRAYNAVYIAMRQMGASPEQATELCASKWARINEEEIVNAMAEGLINFLKGCNRTVFPNNYMELIIEDFTGDEY